MTVTTPQASIPQIWDWLAEVRDPEIPVISVVDLGIVRDVAYAGRRLVVTITPTYSGCPASEVIARDIEQALRVRGVEELELNIRIAPPWTSDWITERGRRQLRDFGIAPPVGRAAASVAGLPRRRPDAPVRCPRCGSSHTEKISEFGSTPCKAHYRCRDCLEPFDYFKCL